jgi:hypothetical protein
LQLLGEFVFNAPTPEQRTKPQSKLPGPAHGCCSITQV